EAGGPALERVRCRIPEVRQEGEGGQPAGRSLSPEHGPLRPRRTTGPGAVGPVQGGSGCRPGRTGPTQGDQGPLRGRAVRLQRPGQGVCIEVEVALQGPAGDANSRYGEKGIERLASRERERPESLRRAGGRERREFSGRSSSRLAILLVAVQSVLD